MTDLIGVPTETRRRRKAERPKEILEAAFEEFSRNGYAATTLDQVAERAGVTKGTIYVYFENKEHLFISMVRELTKATLDTVHEMFERHDGSTADLLRAQFSFIYEHIVEDRRRREVVRMLIAEAPRFPALAERYYEEIHRPCMTLLKQAIQRGIDRGEIRQSAVIDCPQVIIAPIAMVDLWMMMFDERQPLDLKAYFKAHLDLVLNGLLAKRALSLVVGFERQLNQSRLEWDKPVQRSIDRILTTHCGSLPRPQELLGPLHQKDAGLSYDHGALATGVQKSVRDVVAKQIELGVDIVDDGEHSKASFATYARKRIGGLEFTDRPRARLASNSRDALAFPAVYAEMQTMFAARTAAGGRKSDMKTLICTGPIKYIGQAELKADIDNLKQALAGKPGVEGFITAISPTNLEMYFPNSYYGSDEEYLVALAEAMNEEYRAIVDAGFLLQIDDPRLITHFNRTPGLTLEECRKFIAAHIDIVNHALKGIPEDRVRFHTCYSVNVAPRVHDLELKHYVDLMLRIKAQAYSIEGANPRHEHEWRVWEEVKLPPGKVLLPGVVSHCVYQVEHPELVAQRIERFAGVVGRENVIASNDCGFATSAAGDEVHPDVAWAKLASLSEGARIASKRLWA